MFPRTHLNRVSLCYLFKTYTRTRANAFPVVLRMLTFQFTYVATIGPLYYTMQAETPATRLRDKTVRLGATVNIVTMYVYCRK